MKSDAILMHSFEEFAELYHCKKSSANGCSKCDTVLTWKCKKCGNVFQSKLNLNYHRKIDPKNYARCLKCHPYISSGKSNQEIEFFEYVKSIYSGTVISSDRTQIKVGRNPSEIDVWLPELKIGFEYNGLFQHSIRKRHKKEKSNKCRKMTHILKNKVAEKAGIKLVQIWEHEWLYEKENIKKLIRDIIFNEVNFSKYIFSENPSRIKVPRDKFNTAYKIDGYILLEISKPVMVKLKFLHGRKPEYFSYKNCGYLIYEKI